MSSYNCRSLGPTRYDTVKDLLAKSDFCLIQEHWLYPERFLEVIGSNFEDIECIVDSPMKEYELTQGRPRGGTAILYHSNINAKIERVETDSDRLTAIVATIDAVSILLISVYMPWDEQREGDNSCHYRCC